MSKSPLSSQSLLMTSVPEKIIPEKLIGYKSKEAKNTFTDKDCILYALGIGFSRGTLLPYSQIHYVKKISSSRIKSMKISRLFRP